MALRFNKRKLGSDSFEACSVFDVNGDGVPDIVSGAYWYEGPDFTIRHKICDIAAYAHYRDDFSDFPMDVDGDGRLDIITGSWWSEALKWRRNPGNNGEWETFVIDPSSNIETIRYLDIDGCGVPEIFPNTPGAPQAFYKLIRDEQGRGTGQFRKIMIGDQPSGHGLGFADITGSGKMDIVLCEGWLEQPDDPFTGPWKFHAEFSLGPNASVPILGYDVNGNGLCDLIVGKAHDYGLHWYEQTLDEDGTRSWIKHEIDASASQYHDLALVDLDLDGELELVTGKRYLAHDNDPGFDDPLGLYYFKINKGEFEKHVIDYGPAGEASGNGIYMWIQDLTGNGYPDIVAPGTEGLFLFENWGPEETSL